jgi:hypothetical protein
MGGATEVVVRNRRSNEHSDFSNNEPDLTVFVTSETGTGTATILTPPIANSYFGNRNALQV